MTVVIIALIALAVVLLNLYIRHWLGRMLPGLKKRWRAVLTVLLAAASLYLFAMPSIVLLHFWLISALAEGLMLLLRRGWGRAARLALPAVLTAAVMAWGAYNMAHPTATRYVYETEKPIRPEGYRVVLISDTHFGAVQDPKALEAAVPQINALRPDLIVLGGDLVEESTSREQMHRAMSVLGRLESTFGTYAVFGNHDRQAYSAYPKYSVEELTAAMAENGITLLKNSYTAVNGEIILAGLEDRSWHRGTSRMETARVLDGADPGALVIAADHQPNGWRENGRAGVELQLSGHTHAGQIFPMGLFIRLTGGLNYGRYDLENCTVIVSSGFAGWGFPIRTQQRSEYVIVDIVPGGGTE